MARTFTSASGHKIILSLGNLGFVFGPGTVAAIIRPTNFSGDNRTIISAGATNAVSWMLQTIVATGTIAIRTDGTEVHGTTGLTLNAWHCIAITKASGNVRPVCHIYPYATDTWVHENASGNRANSSTPLTQAQLGCTPAGAGFCDGDIAVAAAWNVVLTNNQVEALAYDMLAWFVVQPQGLFVLDQSAVAQTVPDLSGGGANQSSITGTTVATSSVPVWSPGVGVMSSV